MPRKLTKLVLLMLISFVTLFIIYPLLHELGHALATMLLGGRISGFSLSPLPHVESALPYNSPPIKTAVISLSGMLFPVLLCLPFLKLQRFGGYVVVLILLISAIACVVELCIAIQYAAGDIVENDDIVVFLEATAPAMRLSYLFTGGLALICFILMAISNPLTKLEQIARPIKSSSRKYSGKNS